VGTTTLVKPSALLDPGAAIELVEPERFVSRGGYKLEAALAAFEIDAHGKRCLDLGASTGGFTDCLLQRGAVSVLAIDVGRAQLHQSLRDDPRVTLLDGTNARALPKLPPIDLFVADLSFISLRIVLPSVARRLAPGTPGVLLFKPQFEAGKADVPRGGVLRDEAVRDRVLQEFVEWARAEDWQPRPPLVSPIAGGSGNIEFLLAVTVPQTGVLE
jgi:23S rRNA (cytidine1920-2'-O)/16S rRNA (cytidine1409-2'-O)-methyltransferase